MGTIVCKEYIRQTKVKVQTVPYISTAHCTLAPYASAGVALRSNADESRELYGTFGKKICWMVGLWRNSASINIVKAIHNKAGGSRMTPEIKPAINK
jgi:hypothetical protein